MKRKTAKGLVTRALLATDEWMRKHRHVSVREQWKALNQKLVGHFRYYGLMGNSKALSCFRYEAARKWR